MSQSKETHEERVARADAPEAWASLPLLLTVEETALLLRTTRTAIWAAAARGTIPGVRRVGRRLLFNRDDLVRWLCEKRTPSPEGNRR